jgi:RNA polymerase primary sigma factor
LFVSQDAESGGLFPDLWRPRFRALRPALIDRRERAYVAAAETATRRSSTAADAGGAQAESGQSQATPASEAAASSDVEQTKPAARKSTAKSSTGAKSTTRKPAAKKGAAKAPAKKTSKSASAKGTGEGMEIDEPIETDLTSPEVGDLAEVEVEIPEEPVPDEDSKESGDFVWDE